MAANEKMAAVKAELARLHREGGVTLTPARLVDAASDEDSPLHSLFQWDDTEAAKQYRLWQARRIIGTVYVEVVKGQQVPPTRVYVSLKRDRANREDGGGYRRVVDVMASPVLRSELLAEALREFEYFERKYSALKELSGLFAEAKKVRQKAKDSMVYATV